MLLLSLTFSSNALWCSKRDFNAFKTSTSLETPAGDVACLLTTVIRRDRSCRDTRHSRCSSNSWKHQSTHWGDTADNYCIGRYPFPPVDTTQNPSPWPGCMVGIGLEMQLWNISHGPGPLVTDLALAQQQAKKHRRQNPPAATGPTWGLDTPTPMCSNRPNLRTGHTHPMCSNRPNLRTGHTHPNVPCDLPGRRLNLNLDIQVIVLKFWAELSQAHKYNQTQYCIVPYRRRTSNTRYTSPFFQDLSSPSSLLYKLNPKLRDENKKLRQRTCIIQQVTRWQ